jgi:hypothetical protein
MKSTTGENCSIVTSKWSKSTKTQNQSFQFVFIINCTEFIYLKYGSLNNGRADLSFLPTVLK